MHNFQNKCTFSPLCTTNCNPVTETHTQFTFLPAGGGAIEMELSKYLRDYSRTIAGKEQLLIGAMAKALEIIPRQLCDNAGFDATNILNKLRQRHALGKFAYFHWNSKLQYNNV